MRAGMVLLMPRLRRFARALTGSWHQADDLVQDTIVRAMASWNDATRLIYMEGWVLRIMRNAWIDMQRARRVRLEYADAFRMWSHSASNDEDATIARLTLGTVEAALRSLPEDQRTVLLLVCVEEMSYAQAAAILDIPVGTVMSRLARGRATLRQLLDEPHSRQQAADRNLHRTGAMTHYDDETLGAYVDGELERETAAALEADLGNDPVLQRRVADLRAINAALREWSASRSPRGKPCGRPVRSSPDQNIRRRHAAFGFKPLWSHALAAGVALVFGLGIGQFVNLSPRQNGPGVEEAANRLLQAALEHTVSGQASFLER